MSFSRVCFCKKSPKTPSSSLRQSPLETFARIVVVFQAKIILGSLCLLPEIRNPVVAFIHRHSSDYHSSSHFLRKCHPRLS